MVNNRVNNVIFILLCSQSVKNLHKFQNLKSGGGGGVASLDPPFTVNNAFFTIVFTYLEFHLLSILHIKINVQFSGTPLAFPNTVMLSFWRKKWQPFLYLRRLTCFFSRLNRTSACFLASLHHRLNYFKDILLTS